MGLSFFAPEYALSPPGSRPAAFILSTAARTPRRREDGLFAARGSASAGRNRRKAAPPCRPNPSGRRNPARRAPAAKVKIKTKKTRDFKRKQEKTEGFVF